MNNKNNTDDSFIDYNINDTKYAGAESVVKEELAHLKNSRQSDPDKLKGLALSGGGIRSASFCLGVIQSLAKHDKLKAYTTAINWFFAGHRNKLTLDGTWFALQQPTGKDLNLQQVRLQWDVSF